MKNAVSGLGLAPDAAMVTFPIDMFLPGSDISSLELRKREFYNGLTKWKSDFAIASGGFVLISTDNVGEDPLWQMYNVMRGRDYIHLGMLRALRFFLGRFNIIGHTVQAILNTMEFFLRDLEADQHILGYDVNFRTEGNSPEQIRLGHLTVGFRAEEPPVLKHITIESSRYREAIDAMVSDLATQLNLAS